MTMRRLLPILVAVVVAFLAGPRPAAAQSADDLSALRQEIEALKAGQEAIQRDLEEIKDLLRGRAARPSPPRDLTLSVKDDPFKGDRGAAVTLVEFSDYQCPFCARHFRDTLPQLEQEYVATGKVRYVFRNFPIEALHPQAFKAHEAANCAGDQGKYWPMHDRLFANQRAFAEPELAEHARAVGLDVPGFRQCLESGKHAAKVRGDIADARRAGVQGTPTFFLGLTAPDDGDVRALSMIRGAQPYAAFKQAIEALLAVADKAGK